MNIRTNKEIMRLVHGIEDFEATESRAQTGTGSRREGGAFEDLIAELWLAFGTYCEGRGATRSEEPGATFRKSLAWRKHVVQRLEYDNRALIIPHSHEASGADKKDDPRWLETEYRAEDLVSSYPGEEEAARRYAPEDGPYSGDGYPAIYTGLSTGFDDTIVLVEDDVLREKILLEYKTAKSSKGRQIDGNAHERLSFQMMQYLEASTRYTSCSFVIMANGAFTKYRNKYHVNFHIQADRMRCFAWFSMQYAATKHEYLSFLNGLAHWLIDAHPRNKGDV